MYGSQLAVAVGRGGIVKNHCFISVDLHIIDHWKSLLPQAPRDTSVFFTAVV